MPSLHERLAAKVAELRAVAEAASKAKPGQWIASPTHDGSRWTGHSHVFAEERYETETVTGTRIRGVAHQIADSLNLVTSSFAEPNPAPAAVAVCIVTAVNLLPGVLDWAQDVLRRHEPGYPLLSGGPWCNHGGVAYDWPCAEVLAVARALGVSPDA